MPGHPAIHVDELHKCTNPRVYHYDFFLPDKAWRKLPYLHTFLHKLQLILCTGTFILLNFKTAQRTGRTSYLWARADATFSCTAAPFKATSAACCWARPWAYHSWLADLRQWNACHGICIIIRLPPGVYPRRLCMLRSQPQKRTDFTRFMPKRTAQKIPRSWVNNTYNYEHGRRKHGLQKGTSSQTLNNDPEA
jgi:hypothetical protein